MLDAFCATLSDEAQLKIAVRLAKLALPIWANYHERTPVAIHKLDELISDVTPIRVAAERIDKEFLERALEKVERSLVEAKSKTKRNPVALMKSDATLSPMLATIMQPLTNNEWENLLPQAVKLVYTSVFNILLWILIKRRNASGETHIYVAINQAADALMRESILSAEQINPMLDEYNKELRKSGEEEEWENALKVGRNESFSEDDIYSKIIGEKVNKDQCGYALAKEVLRQMKDEKKSFWDEWDEYQTGTSKTYSYNLEKNSFWRTEADVIVGSFFNEIPMSEGEMRDFVSGLALADLRTSGFEV
jgi:hypothetical protein